jgi:N-acetyl-anhydromuramyl-L-alanine amidase AmpD
MRYLHVEFEECSIERFAVRFVIDEEVETFVEEEGYDLDHSDDFATIADMLMAYGYDHEEGDRQVVRTKSREVVFVRGIEEVSE